MENIEDSKKIERIKDRPTVVNYEKGNFDKIIFIQSGKDFWEAIEASALIMFNEVQPQIGLKTPIRVVQDYYSDRPIFRLVHHASKIKMVVQEMTKLGLELLRDDHNVKILKLTKELDKKTLGGWRKTEEAKTARIGAKLKPFIKSTEMSDIVRNLGDEVVLVIDHMRASLRGTFDKELLDIVLELHEIVNDYEDRNKELPILLRKLSFLLTILYDKNALEEKRALRIGTLAMGMIKITNAQNAKNVA